MYVYKLRAVNLQMIYWTSSYNGPLGKEEYETHRSIIAHGKSCFPKIAAAMHQIPHVTLISPRG